MTDETKVQYRSDGTVLKETSYEMRPGSVKVPLKFNDAEKAIEDENKFYRKVHNPKVVDINKEMEWENLYFEEMEDYNRTIWIYLLIVAVIMAGRLLL